jgi:hypothetical protein
MNSFKNSESSEAINQIKPFCPFIYKVVLLWVSKESTLEKHL